MIAKNRKSVSVGQINKIVDFVRQVVKDMNLNFVRVQAFIDNADCVARFKIGLKTLLREAVINIEEGATNYELAIRILGDDFIAPAEIYLAYGFNYSVEQSKELADTLPSLQELTWLRDNSFMLIAGPPEPLSFLEIRSLKPEHFYAPVSDWYECGKERFAHDDKVTMKWLMLRKGPVPNSQNKDWNAQLAPLSELEYVPNVAEATWGIATYKEVRKVRLFPVVRGRTSSRQQTGYHVHVGEFADTGLHINDSPDASFYRYIGLFSARKPK